MFQLDRAFMHYFTVGLFVCLLCLCLNLNFIVNWNYHVFLCYLQLSIPPPLIPPLLCHHSISFPLFLSVHSLLSPPHPMWWNSGWRRLFFFSVLQQALIAGLFHTQKAALSLAGHTTLQLTFQQQQRQLQPSQLNAPPLSVNHYTKEGRKHEWGRRLEGNKNETEENRGYIKESERMSLG